MDKAIIVDHLFRESELNDVSFTIQKGEFVGIIGSKDSGKNSIVKIIAGLLKPASGFVSVLGYDPFLKSHDLLSQTSYLNSQINQVQKNSSAIDKLEITKAIYGLSNREFNKNLSELTQFIKNPNLLDAFIYKPKVVILDEPNLELDSVYEYNKRSESTILLSTEKIDDLINLVRRLIIISSGNVLFDGAIDEVITKFATEKIIKVKLSGEVSVKEVGEIATVKNYSFPELTVSAPRSVISFTAAELMQNFPVTDISIQEMSIEEIISNMKI